jgi:alkylhydroperoxidase domain protein/CMD domain protein
VSADIISSLAGIAEGSPLAELRAQRPESRDHAQGSYEALFAPAESTGLSGPERYAVALRVASHHAAPEAIEHYRAGLVAAGADDATVKAVESTSGAGADALPTRLQALIAHADLLSTHPVDATPDSHQALSDAGLSTGEIVTLSQIIAFLSFQIRAITALQLMGGGSGTAAPSTAAVPAALGATTAATVLRPEADLKRPAAFTRDQLGWTPWLEPLDPEQATPRQAEGLASRPPSPYFRLLGWDGDILRERTATDLGIFYTHGGAPRADRELAAAAASRLNGCVFCASVHARAAATYSKREADIDRLLDEGIGDIPALELGDRWTAVVDLAVALARTPSKATRAQIERLRSLGLSELEILDVAQSAAFFSWANRLMLTLGEPYYP